MKNKVIISIYLLAVIGLSSCVDFLNRTPDSVNFTEDQIFTDYAYSQGFIDQLLVPFYYFEDNDWGGAVNSYGGLGGKSFMGLRERISDNCLNTKIRWVSGLNWRDGTANGNDGMYMSDGSEQKFQTQWKAIRICNMSIANVDRIVGVTPEQKAKILGQAYFLRGHFYFMLLQGWGGMPYVTDPLLDPNQEMDFARLSYRETAQKIAEDFDLAAQNLPVAVATTDIGRPTQIAALAYKAKALTWGASPYSNPESNQTLWANAAVACAQAIKAAEDNGYALVTLSEFKNLFVNTTTESLKEIIFGRFFPTANTNGAPYYCGIKSQAFGNSWQGGAESPTENLAQTYQWANGDPIDQTTTEYQNNPFYGDPTGAHKAGRDPRFYETLIFNDAITAETTKLTRRVRMWNKSTWVGPETTLILDGASVKYPANTDAKAPEELLSDANGTPQSNYTITGYNIYKLYAPVWGVSQGNKANLCTNIIRLADLYLYYAECANRAWGYNAAPVGTPAGFSYTALQSLNNVRNRKFGANVSPGVLTGKNAVSSVGHTATDPIMPAYNDASANVNLKVESADRFDLLVRNETRVENAFEEKHFYDLRRWRMCTDPNVLTMKGLNIERIGVNKFKYTVVVLPDGPKVHLKWQNRHHLFKLPINDTYIGTNFKQNPGW